MPHVWPISAPGWLVVIFMRRILPERTPRGLFQDVRAAGRASAAMNAQTGERLRDRHQFDRVDIDVRRARGDPVDRIGDVLGRERLHVLVDLAGLLVVTAVS